MAPLSAFPRPNGGAYRGKTLTVSLVSTVSQGKAPPLLPEHLIKIVEYLLAQSTLAACRDNALLQVGFLGAFRRSELVAIKVEDIDWQPAGIEILIPKSKTDQLNAGQYCVIPNGNEQLCAVRALKSWLKKAGIKDGFVFRRIHRSNKTSELSITPDSVNEILKTCCCSWY